MPKSTMRIVKLKELTNRLLFSLLTVIDLSFTSSKFCCELDIHIKVKFHVFFFCIFKVYVSNIDHIIRLTFIFNSAGFA